MLMSSATVQCRFPVCHAMMATVLEEALKAIAQPAEANVFLLGRGGEQ
jgi:hypothetical protein